MLSLRVSFLHTVFKFFKKLDHNKNITKTFVFLDFFFLGLFALSDCCETVYVSSASLLFENILTLTARYGKQFPSQTVIGN